MLRLFLLLFLLTGFFGCKERKETTPSVKSPDGRLEVTFLLREGQPFYRVDFDGSIIVGPSRLGFKLKGEDMSEGLIAGVNENSSYDQKWETVWGEQAAIRNNYNQLKVKLRKNKRPMHITFKVYNDGLGFRYELPEQPGIDSILVMDELTEFNFNGDHNSWYLPVAPHPDYKLPYNTYERLYKSGNISTLDSVHTPVTFETADGLYLSLHEANLTDYASMTLKRGEGTKLAANLVPWPDDVKVRVKGKLTTPWRTIQIAREAGELITSPLVLNLNDQNTIEDVSWIKPMKYVGIWWEMHLGKSTWEAGAKHGATTENVKRHIDFAAEHNIGGVLVEGWNTGWEQWESWKGFTPTFDFVTPYPDFALEELVAYAKEKDVQLILHHETSGDVRNYELHMDSAFSLLNRLGVNAIKSGYVGPINPKGQHHHGQYMVNHYQKAVQLAARNKVMLDVHEPIKPTGLRRTWPNLMTREGVRGMEYNAWSEGNPPEHTTILPFTRGLAGPIDYTPGIFDIEFNKYKPNNSVKSTLANQLALYVVLYSPLQMAADLIENYEGHEAFKFVEDVPVDWETTKVLNGKIGDYITVVRKDRNSPDWYLGSITDENARELKVSLGFLGDKTNYVAEVYADGPEADWKRNPLDYRIVQTLVTAETEMELKLAAGGGVAIRFRPATEADVKALRPMMKKQGE